MSVAVAAPVGQITEFSSGLNSGSSLEGIAPGPDGNMWFTDQGTIPAIGRITPSGTIAEFSAGLQPGNGSSPEDIAQGPDGNVWFTDFGVTREIGRIGAGVSAASIAAPVAAGSGQQGTQQVCEGDRWADWAGQQPLVNEFGFDGYQWLRDGSAIAGDVRKGVRCTGIRLPPRSVYLTGGLSQWMVNLLVAGIGSLPPTLNARTRNV